MSVEILEIAAGAKGTIEASSSSGSVALKTIDIAASGELVLDSATVTVAWPAGHVQDTAAGSVSVQDTQLTFPQPIQAEAWSIGLTGNSAQVIFGSGMHHLRKLELDAGTEATVQGVLDLSTELQVTDASLGGTGELTSETLTSFHGDVMIGAGLDVILRKSFLVDGGGELSLDTSQFRSQVAHLTSVSDDIYLSVIFCFPV